MRPELLLLALLAAGLVGVLVGAVLARIECAVEWAWREARAARDRPFEPAVVFQTLPPRAERAALVIDQPRELET